MTKENAYGTLKENVDQVLKRDKRARENSAWLLYCIWRRYTKIFIPYKDFEKLPSPEGIMRVRRTIQHQENKYNEHEQTFEEGITYEKPIENEINKE